MGNCETEIYMSQLRPRRAERKLLQGLRVPTAVAGGRGQARGHGRRRAHPPAARDERGDATTGGQTDTMRSGLRGAQRPGRRAPSGAARARSQKPDRLRVVRDARKKKEESPL